MSKPQKATDPIAAIHAEAEKARRSADKIGIMSIKSANDAAVLEAYGFPKDATESDIVARLFKMYQKLTR